jgi:hypothetical protein
MTFVYEELTGEELTDTTYQREFATLNGAANHGCRRQKTQGYLAANERLHAGKPYEKRIVAVWRDDKRNVIARVWRWPDERLTAEQLENIRECLANDVLNFRAVRDMLRLLDEHEHLSADLERADKDLATARADLRQARLELEAERGFARQLTAEMAELRKRLVGGGG